MIKSARILRALVLSAPYFLRLPFVALKVIFREGWSGFRARFEGWSERFSSGQLKYEIATQVTARTVVHDEAIFGEKVDHVPAILEILKNQHQLIAPYERLPLDVVVAIHNAYDDTLRCLYSLFKYQDIYRVILLDDCSTDPRIKDFLRILSEHKSQKKFTIEANSRNLGYLKTANKGIEMVKGDVILLNSDTVVTSGWARKMMACAYSRDGIATVTPFTNNGRMCSIPEFLENNRIPAGFTIDSFAECVESASCNGYPELATAVGFCMYVRRQVINEVGLFDETTFGKGYGEEVDFSFRAAQKGYKNVLCDNTFVFHSGGASFLGSQLTAMLEHHMVLQRKYPELWSALASFERSNPLKHLHNRLNAQIGMEENQRVDANAQ